MTQKPVTSIEIAEAIGATSQQVQYRLLKLGIQPVRRVGRVRLFPPEAVEQVRADLHGPRAAADQSSS